MRMIQMVAVLLAVAGASAVTPAAASTNLARPAPVVAPFAQPGTPRTDANQYRGRRYGYRYGRGYGRGWRGGGYRYRPRYAYRPYRWRPRLVCRTSWRFGRPHRVCWRR